jgi:enoyl-CoA hydratase
LEHLAGEGFNRFGGLLAGLVEGLEISEDFLDAQTACDWGLVNRVVPAADLLTVAKKLAADMATIPVETLTTYKRIIDGGYALSFGDAMAFENEKSTANNRLVTPEAVEARRAGIQARARTQG